MNNSHNKCNHCGISANLQCSACHNVSYCSKEHQKIDWKVHKPYCILTKKSNETSTTAIHKPLIDETLKSGEAVGTFRWNDTEIFETLPPFPQELREEFATDWKSLLSIRMADKSEGDSLVVQPMTIDALSFPMTIVNCIRLLKFNEKQECNILIIGATAKAEERIVISSNYFEEVNEYYQNIKFNLYFVGPEIQISHHLKKIRKNDKLQVELYRGQLGEFIQDYGSSFFKPDNTLSFGFNTGLGSGFKALMQGWIKDINILLKLNLYCVFTCANDYSDVKGEKIVMENILDAKYVLPPKDNEFRAISYYHEPGKRESSWCCSNSFYYIVRGFNGGSTPIAAGKTGKNYIEQKLNNYFN